MLTRLQFEKVYLNWVIFLWTSQIDLSSKSQDGEIDFRWSMQLCNEFFRVHAHCKCYLPKHWVNLFLLRTHTHTLADTHTNLYIQTHICAHTCTDIWLECTHTLVSLHWCSQRLKQWMCQIRVLIKATPASHGAGTAKSFLVKECLAVGKDSSFEKQQEADLDYSRSQNNVSAWLELQPCCF